MSKRGGERDYRDPRNSRYDRNDKKRQDQSCDIPKKKHAFDKTLALLSSNSISSSSSSSRSKLIENDIFGIRSNSSRQNPVSSPTNNVSNFVASFSARNKSNNQGQIVMPVINNSLLSPFLPFESNGLANNHSPSKTSEYTGSEKKIDITILEITIKKLTKEKEEKDKMCDKLEEELQNERQRVAELNKMAAVSEKKLAEQTSRFDELNHKFSKMKKSVQNSHVNDNQELSSSNGTTRGSTEVDDEREDWLKKELQNRVDELESENSTLKRQIAQNSPSSGPSVSLVQYNTKVNQLEAAELEMTKLRTNVEQLKKIIEEKNTKIMNSNNAVLNAEQKLSEANAKNEQVLLEKERDYNNLVEANNKSINDYNELLNKLSTDKATYEESLSQLKEKIEKSTHDVDDFKHNYKKDILSTVEDTCKAISLQNEDYKHDVVNIIVESERLISVNKDLVKKISELRKDRSASTKQIKSLKAEVDELTRRIQELTAPKEEHGDKKKFYKTTKEGLQIEVSEVEHLNEEIKKFEAEILNVNKLNKNLVGVRNEQAETIKELRSDNLKLQEKVFQLRR